jgi:beta-lactamase superfamily II metal-dependent hydrolase
VIGAKGKEDAMSRSAILGMIVLLLPAHAVADRVIPSERVVNGVKVREGRTSDSQQLALLRPGESLEFVEEFPGWYQVRLNNSTRTGFVAKSFTDRVPDEFVTTTPLPPREEDELRVHFLAIGTGTCTVVECPGPNAPPMVVDCGSTGRSDTDLTPEELRTQVQGILAGRTTNVVLSHGDEDHFNQIESVLQGIPLGDVWQGGKPDEYTDELQRFLEQNVSDEDEDLHQDLDKDFHNEEFALDDNDLDCGDASVFILTVNTGVKTNAQSLVMLIEHHDFAVTLTGDAFGKTEKKAWENHGSRVKTTVLSGSHHGASSKGSNGTGAVSSQWPEKTAPEVLVYNAGNKYRHPRCAATKQYHPFIAEVPAHPMRCGRKKSFKWETARRAEYNTRVNGTIVVTSDGFSPLTLWCSRGMGCNTTVNF